MSNVTYGVIYARYSAGPRQTDQSIEGQLRDCYEYAKQNNIIIIDTYLDKHISGTDFENRAEFNRMMRDAEQHKFTVILTWKIDRIGRNREELAMTKVKLRKHDVKILYAKESIPDGPEGIILESLLEGMSEYYSAELSQKIRRGMRETMLKGQMLGGNKMLGYKIENKRYVPDPVTAPVVLQVFQRYSQGETAQSIVDDLNKSGYTTARGTPMKKNSLYYLLRNEKYIGIYRYGEIVLTDAIPAIIPKDLFEKVQFRLNSTFRKKKHVSPDNEIVEYILSGKLFCGYCKNTYIGNSGTGRNGRHHYYKCTSRTKKAGSCESKTVRKEFIEELIIKKTVFDVLTPELIDYLSKKVVSIHKNETVNLLLNSLRQRKKDIEKSISNLMAAIEAGIITPTTKNRLMELEEEKEALEVQITREEIKKPDITEEHVRFWLEGFAHGDITDKDFQIRLINTFLHSAYLYNDKIILIYNFTDGGPDRREIEMNLEHPEIVGNGSLEGEPPALFCTYTNHLVFVSSVYFMYEMKLQSL